MVKRRRNEIVIPPDNYTAIDRQMLRLRAIPARAQAESQIAEKFGKPTVRA